MGAEVRWGLVRSKTQWEAHPTWGDPIAPQRFRYSAFLYSSGGCATVQRFRIMPCLRPAAGVARGGG